MTYTELCTAVADTLENTFTAEDLARFTRLTEQKIFQVVQPPVLRKNQTGAVSTGVQYLSLPNGFLFPYSLAVVLPSGRYEYLLNKDVNYIREVYPFPAVTGTPKTYAMFDENTAILGPTPDTNYAVEIHFAAYPESIVDAGTSWLGTNFDSALFNGMLLEAARFMKLDADLMAQHDAAFKASMAELKQLADGKLRQDAYRSGQVRNPVN
jgi:hypothetical protein